MKSSELLEQSERAHFLLGNEAVVRGLYEAGVSVTATYPGTPSSEIGDLLYETHRDLGIYFEYSVNEKVAFEVAASASSLVKEPLFL
jgi:indolepyruvate ferredoxin oxidoreductase, subunit iorA (EC 1.2.7.8)